MEFNQDVGNNFTHNWFYLCWYAKTNNIEKGRFARSFYIRCQIAIISSKYYMINDPPYALQTIIYLY